MGKKDRRKEFRKELFATIIGQFEGGVNMDETRGDISNAGVRQRVYNSYTKQRNMPQKSVLELNAKEIEDFYWNEFYDRLKLDQLPFDASMAVFDYAIHSGVDDKGRFRATRDLQAVVGTKQDGLIGPNTMKKFNKQVEKRGKAAVMNDFYDLRRTHIDTIIANDPEEYRGKEQGLYNRVERSRALYAPQLEGDL